MTGWSPTRREFLGVAGVGGAAGIGEIAGVAGVGDSTAIGPAADSWGDVTDAVPDRQFVPTAEEHWSLDLGEEAYLTGPVGDALYARTSGTVHAIATDGTRRWRFEVETDYPGVLVGPESPRPAGNRTVYVNDDGRLYALDAADGSERWRYEAARRPAVRLALSDLVVAFDDRRLGNDDALVGLSPADGSERWRFALDGGLWAALHHDGERVYAGTNEGTFYALDVETGDASWQVQLPGDERRANRPPRLTAVDSTADLAFAWDSEAGTLYALETTDGSERWRFDAGEASVTFPGTIHEGAVYLRDGSSLHVLSTADRSVRWRFDAESFLGWPRVVGETAYLGNEDGVWALSTGTGRERWGSDIAGFPAGVADGTLVVATPETEVLGFATDDGRIRWRYDAEESLALSPTVGEDAAYLCTESGTVVAVSDPGPTPVSDALRAIVSPAGLAVGGLLGGALAVGAYRRRNRAGDAAGESAGSAVEREPTTAEDFELVRSVAAADHATVHEACAPDGTRVALKRLQEDEIGPEGFAAAVETWADLDVPGVLDVRSWGHDPVPWVATEYATGGHLGAKSGDLTVAERARVVAAATETVHRAHREGVTHGRLVPGNVLFAPDGVRVGDWRLAAELRDAPEGYRPPEIDTGSGADPAPEATDAYQLAAMADDLLGEDERPSELRDVLSRALAADPADRYDSALKFADALRWAVRE